MDGTFHSYYLVGGTAYNKSSDKSLTVSSAGAVLSATSSDVGANVYRRMSPAPGVIDATVARFMTGLFRSGAFEGSKPEGAFFTKCDAETTTPNDVASGVVNLLVGFAPLKPAEFVVLSISLAAET